MLREEDADILGVCETHLDSIGNSRVVVAGYQWFGNGCSESQCGVGFLVKRGMKCKIIKNKHVKDEGRCILIEIEGKLIMEAYAPVECASAPKRDSFFDDMAEEIAAISVMDRSLIIVGDWNAHIEGFFIY
ncbi:unnamed protein product [Blepharisma stoltei]|uniref:Endonuclease/exonuclease/phosphatase domain-containing protein n=1 Tax=Blepharisma stoltei TaxID=1481888 RepID=A0AAU9K3U8_9CILI|nr:unnamed protein product [Blepharisma stoltei]